MQKMGGFDLTTEYLVKREMEHVLAALTPTNRLVCRVCVATGLRIGDVVSMRTSQLQPQFWITEQKTGKRRRVNLSKQMFEELKAQSGEQWVFESTRGPDKHRTRQTVWADVKRAAKAFRLPQNVGVHSFRKVFAVEQLNKTKGDLSKVQKKLNHADKATTMIYAMSCQLYESKYGKSKKEQT